MTALTIPSPTAGVLWLGPFPVRAYALCIMLGIVLAVLVAQRRLRDWAAANSDQAMEVTFWAVPFGIVGGRLYHVITTPQPYFGAGGHPLDALKIWHGGLGIWGAVMLGAVGAWIGCRRAGVPFLDFADALAPGLLLAQAAGRFGNYFNNEIYGGPTNLPWRLKVYHWDQSAGHALRGADGQPLVKGYYHPTFLYEALWCLLVAGAILLLGQRMRVHRGQLIAVYVMGYTLGRFFIEQMRSDEANTIAGLRVNVWVSVLVFLFGLGVFVWARATQRVRRGGAAGDPEQLPSEMVTSNAQVDADAEEDPARTP